MSSEDNRSPQRLSPTDKAGGSGSAAEAATSRPPADESGGRDQVGARFRALLAEFRGKLESELQGWLTAKEQAAAVESAASRELTGVLTRFVARDGKRLRPALLYYTYRACGGHSDEAVMPMAMAAELLHTYLLIHDDIMDHADTRRGEPSAHVLFRDLHRQRGWRGSSEHFGESVGILLGDLAQSYSLELYSSVDLAPEVAEQFRLDYSAMCQEVILGQYLEMTAGYREHLEEDELLRVLRMKSGRYSVERPVQLGALLARAPESTRDGLNEYGLRLGEAFQLQDDLLGMFGDARTVGKPVGSDLLEGKFTLLIHHALRELSDQERQILQGALGDSTLVPSEVRAAQQRIEASGARQRVEGMVDQRLDQARQALAGLDLKRDGSDFLVGLIDYLRGRKR
jgi:geranylgeranyl diphosphate synthase type I